MFKDKMQAFRVARQAGKLRELAELKKGTRLKAPRSTKAPYQPGSIGMSKVSKEIKENYGHVVSRKGRRLLAKTDKKEFVRFYNN
jgi:hypothetical protein